MPRRNLAYLTCCKMGRTPLKIWPRPRTPTKMRCTARCGALAGVGVFRETSSRVFELTLAAEMLCAKAPNSMRQLILWIADPFHFKIHAELPWALETGNTVCERVTGFVGIPDDPCGGDQIAGFRPRGTETLGIAPLATTAFRAGSAAPRKNKCTTPSRPPVWLQREPNLQPGRILIHAK